MAKRLTRKKLKQKDEFITTTEKLLDLAVDNKRYLFVVGIIVLFVAIFASIGFYYYRNYSKRGSLAYYDGLHYYQVALKTRDKQDITNALHAFDAIRTNFQYLDIAKLALIYEGNCEYLLGDYDKAINVYNTFLSESAGKYRYVEPMAYNGIIQSDIAKNDCKSALVTINNLLNYKDNSMTQLTYLHAVDCYLKMDQPDKALELLDNGVNKYSDNSMLKNELISFIAYVKSWKQDHIVNIKTNTF